MRAVKSYGNTGRYTTAQIEAALVAPNGRISPRFEVFDRNDPTHLIGELTTVTGATYSMDANRRIPTALRLTLCDEDPLLPFATTRPYSLLIKPWVQVGMPDGGTVEWPVGKYPWSMPGRRITSIDPLSELTPAGDFTVSLGDQMWFLEMQGPATDGYTVQPFTNLTGALGTTLTRGLAKAFPAGVDTTRIVAGVEVTAGALSWTPLVGASVGTKGTPGTTWAGILAALHEDAGYTPPRFDDEGVYAAAPMPTYNLFAAEPDWPVTTDRDHLVELPIATVPQVEQIGNVVYVAANNASPDALQGFAKASADDYLPDHPYAPKNLDGLEIPVYETNIAAGEYASLQAAAIALLFKRMALVTKVEFATWFRPGLEPWDLIGLRIPGDPAFDTVHRLMAVAWETDLFTGRMTHKPASISGT